MRQFIDYFDASLSHQSLYINFLSVNDIQPFLQGTEALTLKVVDFCFGFYLIIYGFLNSCRLSFEFASEQLIAILHSYGVTALCVGRDVDAETYDGACIDGFLIDDLARFVSNAYLIGIVEWVKMNA